MDVRFILVLSVLLQLAAAGTALVLIRVTGKRLAWTLIAIAITLMAVRRGISIYRFESGNSAHSTDLYAELVALTISVLMLAGLALIAPVFRAIGRAAAAVRESEEKYRTLVESANDMVLSVSSQGTLLFVNRAVREVLGYTEEELRDRPLFEIIHPDKRAHCSKQFERVMSGTPVDRIETVFVSKAGQLIKVEGHCNVAHQAEQPTNLLVIFRDITARLQAEEALKESEQRLRQLLAVSPAVVYSCGPGPDFPTTYISENVSKQLGYEASDFLADPMFWTKRLHPDDRQRVNDLLAQIDSSDTLTYEYRIRHKAGHYVWLHDELSAFRDEAGHVVRIVGSWFDVTDLRRAKDALQAAHDELEARIKDRTADLVEANQKLRREIEERERIGTALADSEARQRVILQSVPMATYVGSYPPPFSATWVSEQIETLSGFPAERFVGRPGFWLDRIHPEDRGAVADRLGSLLEDVAVENEYRWKCADGKYRWFLDRSVLNRGDDGKPREVIGTWLDITERKQAEEELKESSATLARLLEEQHALLENTRDFVYRHDTAGVFNYLSPAIEPVTGYSVAEWWKHYTAYMTDNPINQKVIEYTEQALCTGKETSPYLVEITHKNGYPITLEVSERPYFEAGKVAGIVGVARDVTDRVRAQEELKTAKEMAEAANRAKSVFLANISHEIRTPLTAMLGAAELLATKQGTQVPKTSQADMIVRNGRHLLALIDDLLDLSRAEAGRLDVERVPVVLPELMADVRAVVEPIYRRPEVELKIIYETPIPIPIQTDPTRFKQALINLISNALKFTQRGYVRVRVAVDGEAEEPRLRVAVEDTGLGIPTTETGRIFGTFSQLSPVARGVADGVGLGLPLARYIAQRLGGSLTVESREHVGSTFTLRIESGPLDNATWSTPDEIAFVPQGHPHGMECLPDVRLKGRVLLADDFADTRNLIEEVLVDRGADVTVVDNGRAAVDAAMADNFDLILMDIRMPVMDGLEATAELRRRRCLVPIIALTASTAEDDRQRILATGFDDLWAKPLTLEHLTSEVAAYIGAPDGDHACGDTAVAGEPVVTVNSARLEAVRAEFAGHLPERLAHIRAAVVGGDMRRAREALHQLVGAGGTHGFMPISDEAARLLGLAKCGTLAGNAGELRVLDALVRHAVDSIPSEMPARPISPGSSP